VTPPHGTEAPLIAFFVKRLLSAAVLILAVSFVGYMLLGLAAGDTAQNILGQNASQAQIDAKNAELGLDQPLFLRYLDWLGSAVTGDLGRSWFTSENVAASLANRLPVTLSLVIGVMIVASLVSFALGSIAAIRRGPVDRVVQVISVIGYGLPGFLVALFLVSIFAVQLGWLPATGYIPPAMSLLGWLTTITLPVLALSVTTIAGVTQQVRSAVAETLQRDYVRTLRSRGLPESQILVAHVLRNAAAPALTVLALQFVGLLSGSVVVESIFALPGLGTMAIQYTERGDVPVVMGLIILFVVIVVIINLLVDLAIGWLSPKSRLS
jgi:peptide/nickel transport system permease protein